MIVTPSSAPFEPTRDFFDEYPTRNNRLLEYRAYVPDGQSGIELARTVMYTYTQWGDTAHITIKDEQLGEGDPPADYDKYYDLNLVYAKNGKLWLALWQDWTDETVPDPFPSTGWMPDNLDEVWEFRFDGGRQRYLAREWVPDSENPFYAEDWTPGVTLWTDYLGNSPYVDYTSSWSRSWQADEETRYLAGMGTQGDQTMGAGGATTYYHGDLIGSTMLLTDDAGETVNTAAYTAFGEYVVPGSSGEVGGELPSDFSRYGYAGAHGYESGMMTLQGANADLPPVTLQHVGERWYQPGLGRFVQRDPIGIRGGLNVYLYCGANPLPRVDPDGLVSLAGAVIWWTGGKTSWMDNPTAVRNVSIASGAVGGFIIACLVPPAALTGMQIGAFAWGGYSTFGGSTGSAGLDNALTGASLGVGGRSLIPGRGALITPRAPAAPRISVNP